ncbi:unnamed protein product [Owenia fusiformis]|uniref:Uncharacterized protein n=1 Tax=Owenia fusiformis TaxID=6347 RepID=A0A8J1UMR3_OWEFU|nr:unnamed protein product [Owenia fusiformis]
MESSGDIGITSNITTPPSLQYGSIALATMISVIATVGNGLIILVIVKTRSLHTPTHYLIGTLSLADLLTGSIGNPLHLYASFGPDDYKWCALSYTVLSVFLMLSTLTVTCIAVERYIAIMHPFFYIEWMTIKKMCITIASLCVFSVLVLAYLPVYYGAMVEHPDRCIFTLVIPSTLGVPIFTIVTLLCIITASIYLKILQIARAQAKKMLTMETGSNVSSTKSMKKETKTTIFLCFIVFYFICSWSLNICITLLDYANITAKLFWWYVAMFLSISNSAINPVLYGLGYQEYRRAIKRLMHNSLGNKTNVIDISITQTDT